MKTIKHLLKSRYILLLTFSFALTAGAVATQVLYQRSGVSRFKLLQASDGTRTAVKTLQDYVLFRKYSETLGDELFLVSSQKTVNQFLDAEGATGSVSWSVRKGPRLKTSLWSRTESATEFNVHGVQPVLVSGLGGCCGEMTGYRLFNLETGRLLMSFNDFSSQERVVQPFSLEVPNSDLSIRYIGGITQDSTRDRDFIAPVSGKSATLLIKYARKTLVQKIQVDMSVATGYAPSVLVFKMEKDPAVPGSGSIEIRDNQIQLWNIDGTTDPSQIRGVVLKIVLDAGLGSKTIRIPVQNDQLNLGSASIPSGVVLRSIAL